MLNGRTVKLKPLSAELGVNYNTFRKWVWKHNLKTAVRLAKMDRFEREEFRYKQWLKGQKGMI